VRKIEILEVLLLRRVDARFMTEVWASARARSWGVWAESRDRFESGGRDCGGVAVRAG
jgi:hypothetical protein